MLQITPSERAALQLLATETAATTIAERLGISHSEIEAYLIALFGRMGVRTRAEAIAAAFRRGLLASE
ncbi:MAG TPA: LuxR C-terminal-related transcriptional regulator [Vicinamibacterales bacterium]|nr:LuxR C-terminal-related transcriptional regulator [Vicinamibacterales bacterium]